MSENWSQLDGGRFLADLFQKDSIQGNFLQKVITAINKLGSTVGANPVGEVQPPPPINNINIKTSGELMQVTLNHNVPISRNCNYFVEVANEPNFKQPIVHQLGVSRSSPPITLPTFDDAGVKQNYYVQAYAQYPGSKPSKVTRFGGPLNPASIQMGGATEMSLLPSTGSGTASPTGQQGGSGFGKVLNSPTIQGPIQSSIAPASTQANTTPSSGLVGSLLMPSIFSVGGAFPLTGEPSGGAIDVAFLPEAFSTFLAAPVTPVIPSLEAYTDEIYDSASAVVDIATTITPEAPANFLFFAIAVNGGSTPATPNTGWSTATSDIAGTIFFQANATGAVTANATLANSGNNGPIGIELCFTGVANSSPAIVQNVFGAGGGETGSGTIASFGSNLTAGNSIIVFYKISETSVLPTSISLTDSQGNTYVQVAYLQNSASFPTGMLVFVASNIIGGADTLTYHVTGGNTFAGPQITVDAYEVSNLSNAPSGIPSFRLIENIDLVDAVFGPSGPNHQVGAVPDPGSTAGTTRFLREDATWDVPPSSVNLIQVQLTFSNAAASDGQDTTAQVIVTGQTWVTAGSIIVATVAGGTANHPDPDEPAVETVTVAVGDLVAGTGFTVSAYAPRGTWGTYYVNCIGM